jgi:[ribosomal protein S18]-alanine N-acetyltransferase
VPVTIDRVRWVCRRDMPEILAIERASFEHPWTEEDFLRCYRQRNCIGMVADEGERVVGFMVYELHKTRLHVLNFAVLPACRRQGVGGLMAAKLAHKLSTHRRTSVTLTVRETNLSALAFFRWCGFEAIGLLPCFYEEDSGEDAVTMRFTPAPVATPA